MIPMLDSVLTHLGYADGEKNSDTFFPYRDHIAPTVMLNTDNSIMSVLRMPGAPFATVATRPSSGVSQCTIKLVSVSGRVRKIIP